MLDSPDGELHAGTRTCRIPAHLIAPGDHLPPQAALHGTTWQRTGFTVGPDSGDVLPGAPVLPGRLLLFGANGVLDSIRTDALVIVRRGTSRTVDDQHQ